MTQPQGKVRRASRVIRLHMLGQFTGSRQTQNDELVRLGLLHPYSLSPGGRSKVVDEDEVIELQDAAKKAGSLEALIARVRAERESAS
jgi:hypothetical protein